MRDRTLTTVGHQPVEGSEARGTVPVETVLAMAGAQQRAGNPAAAERLYRQILTKLPQQPQALTMLGSLAYQRGDDGAGDALVERAIAALTEALDAMPAAAPEHAGLANLLLARGRPEDAFERLARVELPLNPVRSSVAEFATRREAAKAAGRPSILMTTMPKSASESLWNHLAIGLGLGQSHVSIGLFPDCQLVPCRVRDLKAGGVIAKEHVGPDEHNLAILADAGIDRILVHLRDPRQAVLSWAHFVRDDVSRRMLAPIWRKIVPPAALLDRDLHQVIDWCLDHYLPLLVGFIEGWHLLERDGHAGLCVRCLTFETFVADRDDYLAKVLDFYGLAPNDMALVQQAATIHWRRGETDEWRSVFTAAQRRRAGDALPACLSEHYGWPP